MRDSISHGNDCYLQVCDGISHASLTEGRPDGGISLTGIEGVQVISNTSRKHHRVLHTRMDVSRHTCFWTQSQNATQFRKQHMIELEVTVKPACANGQE